MAKKKYADIEIIVSQDNEMVAKNGQPFKVQNLNIKQRDIEKIIYIVWNSHVMLDGELAMMYGVETKYLKRAFKANTTALLPWRSSRAPTTPSSASTT